MIRVTLRFYAELNDYLPPSKQYVSIVARYPPGASVRDILRAEHVPESSVELIIVGGESVPLDRPLQDGERLALYPMFESMDVAPILALRDHPLRSPRFVLDVHLGKLAAYLRMLGFDAWYESGAGDPELIERSLSDHRTLLSRDRALIATGELTHAYCVRSQRPKEQVAEVIARFDLRSLVRPFVRCIRCNALLRPVHAADVVTEIPPRVRGRVTAFTMCPACGKVYWRGSHVDRMEQFILHLTANSRILGTIIEGDTQHT